MTAGTAGTEVLIYGGLAGIAIPIGALLSRVKYFHSRWAETELRHGVTAFGAGALLSAIALVLVPAGIETLSLLPLGLAFFAGGIVFALINVYLDRKGTPLGMLVGMLTDYVPECLALGALFLEHRSGAILLAVLIGVQNLPEAFGSYDEITEGGTKAPGKMLIAFACLAPIGPLSTYLGLSLLSDSPTAVALIMVFAAGGILYLMFQDIAPKVVLKKAWLPPLGALAGFFVGIAGSVLES